MQTNGVSKILNIQPTDEKPVALEKMLTMNTVHLTSLRDDIIICKDGIVLESAHAVEGCHLIDFPIVSYRAMISWLVSNST